MKVKVLIDKSIVKDVKLEMGKTYEVVDVVQDAYKVKLPMKQKGKFRYALIKDDEGVLVD